MSPKAAKHNQKATTAQGVKEQNYAAAEKAGRQFMTSSLDMGWRMALMVLIPVFIGVQLDKKFNSSPSYTLAALFIAVGGAVYVAYKTIKNVEQEQKK